MRLPGAFLCALLLVNAAPAFAEMPAECRIAETLNDFGVPLPAVTKALAAKKLNVLVLGAGSSILPGADGAAKAYPARLQAALSERLSGVTVSLATDVKAGRTAADMASGLGKSLASNKPQLVVWQTGTVDAMRSVEPEQFSAALDKGVTAVRAMGADVIFINSQYSPRTESIIALGTYADNMRWVALQQEIPLFDRYSIMKLWAEFGTFDFHAPTKKLDTAERVHDCIGRLLADLIVGSAKATEPPGGGR